MEPTLCEGEEKAMNRPRFDPYTEVLHAFNQKGVRYVVVGVSGINYYAKSPSESFSTQDYDLFLENTLGNLKKAVGILSRLGFHVATKEGPFRPDHIKEIVQRQGTLMATNPQGIQIELLLRISGYVFRELEKDAKIFLVDEVPIRVGGLRKLLMSKKIAGREKDRLFLKRYQANLTGNML